MNGWEKIADFVLKHDYCCGCGLCAGICPSNALEMQFNRHGEYRPILTGECTDCGSCSRACPFMDGNPDEDELGKKLFAEVPEIKHAAETGFYLDTFVGHVADPEHRWRSASGGMATWFLRALLKEKIVDHVICVLPNPDPYKLFRFDIISEPEQIIRSAKSAYYPVEMSNVIETIRKNQARYAVIGLPCFIKSVRLASLHNAKLKERIIVCAGLICGQLKSKGFAEILTRKMGLETPKISRFCFRTKAEDQPTNNFSATAGDENITADLEWKDFYGAAFIAGMFMPRACNFCDDIFAELADISFMDAWLPEYAGISAGTSLVITRSHLAGRIVKEHGIAANGCALQEIAVERVIQSQVGVIEKKRDLIRYRLWLEAKAGRPSPRKRVAMKRPNVYYRFMMLMNEQVRIKSFAALEKQQASGEPGLEIYTAVIKRSLLVGKLIKMPLRLKNLRPGLKRRFLYYSGKLRKSLSPPAVYNKK